MPFTPGAGLTAESRERAMAKRRERAAGLRRDFADAVEWERLAGKYGVRQPAWGEPVSTMAIKRWCKRLGISIAAYVDWWGGRGEGRPASLRDFQERNPDWPLKAWLGLVLEAIDDGKLVQELAR